VPKELIPGDRRADRRYPVDLELRYRVERQPYEIAGKCRDLSSGGIFFSTAEKLKEGSKVEITLDWPFLLQNTCPLKLHLAGHVVRSGPDGTAIKTSVYEFRTAGERSFEEPAAMRRRRSFVV
jgi:PilZ domain